MCFTEAERARQLSIDDFSIQGGESQSTVNQLPVQIKRQKWMLWTFPENSMILKRQAVLGYPTFPVSLWVFWVLVECSAAILACSSLHGTPLVRQDTFLKIYLLQVNHQQHSLEFQEVWHKHNASLCLWTQEDLKPEWMNWKEILNILQ